MYQHKEVNFSSDQSIIVESLYAFIFIRLVYNIPGIPWSIAFEIGKMDIQ